MLQGEAVLLYGCQAHVIILLQFRREKFQNQSLASKDSPNPVSKVWIPPPTGAPHQSSSQTPLRFRTAKINSRHLKTENVQQKIRPVSNAQMPPKDTTYTWEAFMVDWRLPQDGHLWRLVSNLATSNWSMEQRSKHHHHRHQQEESQNERMNSHILYNCYILYLVHACAHNLMLK